MRGGDGGSGEELQREIAIRDAVEAIRGRSVKPQNARRHLAINRKAGARQRGGAQRAFVHPLSRILKPGKIAPKHLNISHHVMAPGHGLGGLQMRKAGHHRRLMPIRLINQRADQPLKPGNRAVRLIANPHAKIQRDLIIARPARV